MVFDEDYLKYMEEIDYENKENFWKNKEKEEEKKKMVHLSLRWQKVELTDLNKRTWWDATYLFFI
jgi:hypothetical protein